MSGFDEEDVNPVPPEKASPEELKRRAAVELVGLRETNAGVPQLMWFEFLAWKSSGFLAGHAALETDMLFDKPLRRAYVASIARAEKTFAQPVVKHMVKQMDKKRLANSSDNSWLENIGTYFRYVWIDAIATSGLVAALYTSSLRKDGLKHSRWNAGYPILVGMLGLPLKAILVAAAIVSIPLMVIASFVAGVAYVAGARKTAKAIMDSVISVIGIIATVPVSHLFLFPKTLLWDTSLSVSVINRSNTNVKERAIQQKEKELEELVARNTSSSNIQTKSPDIQNVKVPEIVATFDIADGLRTDLVTDATKELGGAYFVQPQLSTYDPRNYVRKEFVLEILSSDKKKTLGTIHMRSGHNNLKLQFSKGADVYLQDSLALAFTKMVLNIAHEAKSSAPIKLDISDSLAKEERIAGNIPGLNKGLVAHVKFEDRKRGSDVPELEDADQSVQSDDKIPDTFYEAVERASRSLDKRKLDKGKV